MERAWICELHSHVLGDIAPEQLGVCYAHEHIIIDPGYLTEKFPDFCLDSVELAAAELAQFKATAATP